MAGRTCLGDALELGAEFPFWEGSDPLPAIGVGYKPGFCVIRKDPADNVWDLLLNWHLAVALSSLSQIP